MHLRAPLAVLLVGAIATLPSPASAGAVTIHRHITVERIVGHEADGPLTTPKETVRVVRLKPPDSDDDGLANADDACPQTAAATEDGCPAPTPVRSTEYGVPSTESATTSSSGYAPSGDLAAIAACESGGDPTAVSPDGTYRGLYQFDYGTWASVGGTGDPAAASPEEQTMRAEALMAQSGTAPWPVCG